MGGAYGRPFTRKAVVRGPLPVDLLTCPHRPVLEAPLSPAPTAVPPSPSATAMELLSQGVPLSLLLDLVMGPHSRELLDMERIPGPRSPS